MCGGPDPGTVGPTRDRSLPISGLVGITYRTRIEGPWHLHGQAAAEALAWHQLTLLRVHVCALLGVRGWGMSAGTVYAGGWDYDSGDKPHEHLHYWGEIPGHAPLWRCSRSKPQTPAQPMASRVYFHSFRGRVRRIA